MFQKKNKRTLLCAQKGQRKIIAKKQMKKKEKFAKCKYSSSFLFSRVQIML